MPSRDFMIQQAVLNTIAVRAPWTLDHYGLAAAAKQMLDWADAGPRSVTEWVAQEYRLLASKYVEAA